MLSVALATTAPLFAQAPASHVTVARCARSNRLLGTGAGALVGAFLGLVGAKIRLSDWTAASHTDAAIAVRNRATLGAAAIGAVIGSFGFRDQACGHGARTQSGVEPQADWMRPITAAEIERQGVTGSVYDVVFSLRRNWLYMRGPAPTAPTPDQAFPSAGQPQLETFLDGTPIGAVDRLRDLPITGVLDVRYFDPAAATFRWGGEYSHGVIQVVTTPDAS